MTRIVWLREDGTTVAEDCATGARGLDYVTSARLARALAEGRTVRTEGDDGVTYLVSPAS